MDGEGFSLSLSVLPDKMEPTLLGSRILPPVNLRWHLGTLCPWLCTGHPAIDVGFTHFAGQGAEDQ